MILPRVKSIKENGNRFRGDLLFPKTDHGEKAAALLRLFSPALSVSAGDDPTVTLNAATFDHVGEYRLSVTEQQIVIEYGDYEGLRNAVATLSGLEVDGTIGCAEIADYPDNAFRSCMFDLGRGYIELDVLREHLVRMAKLKFSVAHLHLMDRISYILESDVVPNVDGHRKYTKQEMREIVELCNLLALDAIPEIEFPAHAVHLLKAIPELSCDIIDMDKAQNDIAALENESKYKLIDADKQVSSWTVCIGKESTYQIYEAIIDEIVDIFDSEYLHIGGDEIAFRHLGAYPHWDNCHECKDLLEQYDGDLLSLYHHGIRRIHDIVKSKGKKTIKWNESGECNHAVDLPTDILFQYWHSEDTNDAQTHVNRFIGMGYSIINSPYPYTYVDLQLYMTADKMRTWTPFKTPAQKAAILGGEMCAWEMGNPLFSYYGYTLPVCMALFCDRVWNSDEVEFDDAYVTAVFQMTVGNTPLTYSPLRSFDKIIPARDQNILCDVQPETVDLAQLSQDISALKALDSAPLYGKLALRHYENCLTALLDALNSNP